MKSEYLLFNLIVLAGPLAFSHDRRVRYFDKWPQALVAVTLVAVPFLIWDSLVTGSHWWFDERYTLPIKIAGMPLGEWLFFLSVPFACLFIWQIIKTFKPSKINRRFRLSNFICLILLPAGIILLKTGIEYTGLVLIALALTLFLDFALKTDILMQSRTVLYFVIITALMFAFNGYLTARPVVLYGEEYQLGFRIFTIPIEDFGYGYSLILANTILFEKFKGSADV